MKLLQIDMIDARNAYINIDEIAYFHSYDNDIEGKQQCTKCTKCTKICFNSNRYIIIKKSPKMLQEMINEVNINPYPPIP